MFPRVRWNLASFQDRAAQHSPGRRRGDEDPDCSLRVVTRSKVRCSHRHADPGTHLAPRHDRFKQLLAVGTHCLSHRHRRTESKRPWMDHPAHVNVVELERVGSRCIDERCLGSRDPSRSAPQRRLSTSSLRQDIRSQYLDPWEGEPEEGAADRVEYRELGVLQGGRRDRLVPELAGEIRQLRGRRDVAHVCFSHAQRDLRPFTSTQN